APATGPGAPSSDATTNRNQPPGQHGVRAHTDGGWDTIPVQSRSERFSSFQVDDFPAVTGLELEWKLSPVKALQPLIAGDLIGTPYDYDASVSGEAVIEWLERDDETIGTAGKPEEKASANAWSSFHQALSVRIPAGSTAVQVHIRRTLFDDQHRAAHTVIIAEANSTAMVVVENSGQAQLSENLEIIVGDGAQLTVVTVQEWDDDAHHLASHFASVGRDAKLKHVVVNLGGRIVRIDPSIHLNSEGGETEALGLYFADSHQHLEHRVFINHDAPHTRSRVTYKGALQGAEARTVWIGDVLIRPTAPGTDSYEQNRNLVLTPGARADSVPNLEIETGDILGAGHASTTGRFDDEQLFYLQSRGISESEARRLVVRGFLADIIQQIGTPELETRLLEAIDVELQAGISAEPSEGK
ncbi:MAG: Fe-S cluster assembly protein SufD, partial [Microbacteriaceae bacterium]